MYHTEQDSHNTISKIMIIKHRHHDEDDRHDDDDDDDDDLVKGEVQLDRQGRPRLDFETKPKE